jgi:hypothetical protein
MRSSKYLVLNRNLLLFVRSASETGYAGDALSIRGQGNGPFHVCDLLLGRRPRQSNASAQAGSAGTRDSLIKT